MLHENTCYFIRKIASEMEPEIRTPIRSLTCSKDSQTWHESTCDIIRDIESKLEPNTTVPIHTAASTQSSSWLDAAQYLLGKVSYCNPFSREIETKCDDCINLVIFMSFLVKLALLMCHLEACYVFQSVWNTL
jgi:hypothetical protein